MSAIDQKLTKTSEKEVITLAENAVKDTGKIKREIAKTIFGQELVVENTLVTLLSGGHLLLVGLPGLAKTKLVETFRHSAGAGR